MHTMPMVAGVGAPELMIIALVLLVPVLVIVGVARFAIRLTRRVRDLETVNTGSVRGGSRSDVRRTKGIS